HIGGLRAFVAEGIPVYHAKRNLPLLQKLMKADFKTHPDKEEKLQKTMISKTISEVTKIGKGKNRMIIYPISTEGSEGMLMIYFPEYKLLYTSDMVQSISAENTPYFREYWLEILQAIDREQLEVEKIFGMHQNPVQLSELEKALSPDNAPSSDLF
ncbi:MAG: MBL fold metallo-hydrolase, partial [Salegentibacter sp.]